MLSCSKRWFLLFAFCVIPALPLAAGDDDAAPEDKAPLETEEAKPAFTFDGMMDAGEYENATKMEFAIWNKQTATACFLNIGKYLIVAVEVPEMANAEASVTLLLDTKSNGGDVTKEDDVALKFCPEALESTRFRQQKGGEDLWENVKAEGWLARANQRLINRWQCEMIIDLDALGIKYGDNASLKAALSVVGAMGSKSAQCPQDADTDSPQTWTLELPLAGKDAPGVKIELDVAEITRLQEQERKAAKLFEGFYEKLGEAQMAHGTKVTDIQVKLGAVNNAYQDALRNGDKEKADKQMQEFIKLKREELRELNERAAAYAALADVLDEVIKALGSERAEAYDYKATLLLNLFETDGSSYTTERGARCADSYVKALRVNPNIVSSRKIRLLMNNTCIREAGQMVRAALEFNSADPELRLLAAICDLREGNYKQSAEALEKLKAEQKDNKTLLPEIWQHLAWASAAQALHTAEQERLKKDAKADNLPRVELDTTKGKIVIELFEDDALNTVKNFVSLVEKKYYDGVIFHRVEGWVVQTGDPEGCGMGGPGYSIKTEANNRKHFPGYIGMARTAPDTEGSQFYFMRYYSPFLDDSKFTVFGRVLEGMDVLDKMERMDKINTATVLRKREGTDYKPVRN